MHSWTTADRKETLRLPTTMRCKAFMQVLQAANLCAQSMANGTLCDR
jgi:hypothetical protein